MTASLMMKFKWAVFLIISILSVVVVSLSIQTWGNDSQNTRPEIPTVSTPFGKYKGVFKTYPDGSKVTRFLGVPFALPPLGELRFKKPQPTKKGTPSTVIQANQTKKSCITVTKKSPNPRYGEDCLYLNIYIPGNRSASQVNAQGYKYSVMVWLHPGGFVAGSAYPEPIKLVTRGNVIVVMVNYRMGVLGFLSTNDDALPANNGLWDQYMAIKWVKENIRYFGGDENSITVFGESSGSMSSHILTLSPVASNLFNKVILQSGAASSLVARDYVNNAYSFGKKVGCGQFSNHIELAKCLRNVSISDILQYGMSLSADMSMARKQVDFVWMPIVDGVIIPDYPDNLLKNQSYLASIGVFNKDYMIGILDNEGGLVPENFLYPIPVSTLQNVTFYKDLLNYFFYAKYGIKPDKTSDLIKAVSKFYFGSEQLSFPLAEQSVLDTASDAIFVNPAVNAALASSMCNKTLPPLCQADSHDSTTPNPLCQKATAKVFFYLFDYCPKRDPCRVPCMSHGADFYYEFPGKSTDPVFNKMSDIFVDLLTSFGKTSNPGGVISSGWPTFEPHDQYYLRLSPHPSVRKMVYAYRSKFWRETLPTIVERVLKEH